MSSRSSSTASLEQLLQISSVLKDLERNSTSYSYQIEAEDYSSTSGWTAINRPHNASNLITDPANDGFDGGLPYEVSGLEGECSADEAISDDLELTRLSIEEDLVYVLDVSTGVYMMDAEAGSWSGKLSFETSDEAIMRIVAFNAARRANEMRIAKLKAAERQTVDPCHTSDLYTYGLRNTNVGDGKEDRANCKHQARHQDEQIRTFISLLKQALHGSSVLTLEHTGAHDVDNDMRCRYPACTSDDECIPSHSYYITVSNPGSMENIVRYCLVCLEAMWNGELLIGPLPGPHVYEATLDSGASSEHEGIEEDVARGQRIRSGGIGTPDQSEAAACFSLDRRDSVQPPAYHQTTIDGPVSLLTSKHAPRPDELAASSQDGQPFPTSAMRFSITDFVEDARRRPVTRFQHFAEHIMAGQGLNAAEKVTLEVWKAATKEQFDRRMRGTLCALKNEVKAAELQVEGKGVQNMDETVCLRRSDCYGRDLSEVLMMVGARDDL